MRIIFGDLIVSLKSDHFRVIPIQNITTDNKGIIAGLSPANGPGKKNAVTDKRIAHKGKSLVNKWIIL